MKTIPELLRSVWTFGASDSAIRCRVLFVCMANVCRSPTAEAVFRQCIESAGLRGVVDCASAGTHDFNLGRMPDGRARAVASMRGYNLSQTRARQISDADFKRYDLILAMDRQNMDHLRRRCPDEQRERLRLLMGFARRHAVLDVPDPYYGSTRGFELVLDMLEDACSSLLEHVQATYLPAPDAEPDAK